MNHEFYNLEDIINSKMTIYTDYLIDEYDNVEVKKLHELSNKNMESSHCIDILMKTQNVMCVMLSARAKHFINKYSTSVGINIMKIAKISLRNDFLQLLYEKSSPFAEEFDRNIRLIEEAGLPKIWELDYEVNKTIYDLKPKKTDFTEEILTKYIAIPVIGYTLSILIFVFELVSKYLRNVFPQLY